jgi:hypothetical protein
LQEDLLRGSGYALILYDVGEEIRLEELRRAIGGQKVGQAFKHAAPEYVQFQRPPVLQSLPEIALSTGESLRVQLKYYDYGVVSVLFEAALGGTWQQWIETASAWMASSEFERRASQIVHDELKRAGSEVVKPYPQWLAEDYFIFHVSDLAGVPSAQQLLSNCGNEIAQIVRGETSRLSESERNEVLQSSLSYYPNDLTVIGWHAAFLYDTPVGAQTALQLLEYANSQLLEFRHYDDLLTRELQTGYDNLERGGGVLRRWKLAREANRLRRVTLEITELAERADNAIKFLSDMFSARLYKLAAYKVGVIDYKNLVDQKTRTADSLYGSMISEFYQARAFVLELLVVIILVVEFFFFLFFWRK